MRFFPCFLLVVAATTLAAPPPLDGTNILPNPGFSETTKDGKRPAAWVGGDWGLGSTVTFDRKEGRSAPGCVAVECATSKQRGSWQVRVPLSPGPWKFHAWYRTAGLVADPKKGVDARLTLLRDDGKDFAAFHAYGPASEREWQRAEAAFVAPPRTVAVVVYLFNYFAEGEIRWDDVFLGADVEERERFEEKRRRDAARLKEARAMVPGAKTMMTDVRESLAELQKRAEGNDDVRLLVALLEWAMEDAQLAIDAGLGGQAKATLADIHDYCNRADKLIRSAKAKDHPPKVTAPDDGNPYYTRLNANAKQYTKNSTVYAKGDVGYEQIDNAWTFRSLGEQSAVIAWALLHPRSDLYHDPAVLKRLLVNFQTITQNHKDGDFNPGRQAVYGRDPNINRFCISPMMDAWLMLEAEYPWLILPSKRTEWLDQLRILVDYQYETYGPRKPLDPERPRYYPNMDVHHLLIMEFAHRLLGDSKYADDRETILKWLNDSMYPMGAWTYHWPQNECYVYHALNVTFIARYYALTGDERAKDILDNSRPYYPLAHDGEGMTESYTDCSWKHYWSAASPNGPDVIAGMFDDAANKRAALDAGRRGHGGGLGALYTAPWWKDIPPAAMRDNYLIYDENIQGPAGRYGRFSFAGTARTALPGEIGKDTYVGCMIGDRNQKPLPLDAALQVATIEFRTKATGSHWGNARFCAGSERPSVVVAADSDIASLCSAYRVTKPAWGHGSADQPWGASQQWFVAKDRLFGMLTIRALEETACEGVWGRLRFGLYRDIEPGEESMFRYGSLLAKIHAHNFAELSTAKSETFFLDKPEKFRSQEVLLKDRVIAAGTEAKQTYAKGQTFYFVTEILPYWSDLADDIVPIRSDGLLGFSFSAGDKRYTVVHNPSDTPRTYTANTKIAATAVHRPGKQHVLVIRADGALNITIEPDSHILLESRL
jgi:hypothetical protein